MDTAAAGRKDVGEICVFPPCEFLQSPKRFTSDILCGARDDAGNPYEFVTEMFFSVSACTKALKL
jgi:hypothetical protein